MSVSLWWANYFNKYIYIFFFFGKYKASDCLYGREIERKGDNERGAKEGRKGR